MSDVSTLVNGLGLTDAQIQKLTANLNTLKSSQLLELDSDVARVKEGARMTQAGLDIIAKGNTGATIQFTRVILGDAIKSGEITVPSDDEILEMTNVIHAKKSITTFANAQFTGGGTFTVKFPLNNSDYTESFWCREVGLFAKDPDTNIEVLYCYKNFGAQATFVPSGDGAYALNLIYSVITIVDQTTDVRANVNADFLFVTQADLTAHINDTNPHPVLPKIKDELSTSTYFWATGNDRQLHPVSKSNLQLAILGDSSNALPNLSNRIGQTEMNIANLYAQLKAQFDTGLDANLLLIEDFSTGECIDQFKVDVEHEVAGSNTLCVPNFEGILEGHYYTITDGRYSQYVQVQALANNGTANVIFFTQDLAYNFNLNKTKLCRTTATLSENMVGGSGRVKNKRLDFSADVWKGESSADETVLRMLVTEGSEHYAKGSGVRGTYADFTLDGCFTLTIDE